MQVIENQEVLDEDSDNNKINLNSKINSNSVKSWITFYLMFLFLLGSNPQSVGF